MVKLMRYLLPLLLLLLVSCSKFTAPQRFEGDVYSVAGLILAGAPINAEHPIYVTRSTSIEDFDPYELFVDDATVKIFDLTDSLQWTLQMFPDLSELKIKYIDPEAHIIQAGHTYRLEASIPGYAKLIWAESTVPDNAVIEPDLHNHGQGYSLDEADMNDIVYDQIDTLYPLAINTGENSGTYNFLGEMYCLEEFSTDLEFTTTVLGIEHPDAEMEDAYNAAGESIRRIKFIGKYTSQPQPQLEDNYLVIEDYRQGFVFYGRYRVSLFLVDDNYYEYTFMPEGYFHGGIHNALGYFGSASGGRMYANVIKG